LKTDNDNPGFLLYGSKDALAVFRDVTINSEYRQPVSISNQKAEFYNSTISVEKATNAKIAEKVAEKKAAAAQAAAEAAAETAEEQVEEVTATEEAVVEA